MTKQAIIVNVPDGGDRSEAETEEQERRELGKTPLFAGMADSNAVDHITIQRLAPIREGSLGRLEPDATEEDIGARWGGGKYKLIAKGETGKILAGGFRNVEIAGDPIFATEASRLQYARMLGKPPEKPEPAPPQTPQLGVPELIALISGSDDRRREQAEARAREQQESHARELERIRVEAEIRRREQAETEERRRADEREREERRRKDEEIARQRDREFQTLMLQMAAAQKSNVDPVQMLMQGMQLAREMGGGNEPMDPITALANNIPAIVEKGGALLQGNKPPAGSPTDLTLAGNLGAKGRQAVAHLQSQGVDVEAALSSMFDAVLAARKSGLPAAAAPPAPPRRFPPRPAQQPPPAPARGNETKPA